MKLAYLIAAHRNPGQLQRLLRAIDHPDHVYIIHVDRRADRAVHIAAQAFAAGRPNVAMMPPQHVVWGGPSLLRVQLSGIAAALELDANWQQLINLSGQCYPLVSQASISRALDHHGPDCNYIEVLDYANCSPSIRPRTRYVHVEWGNRLIRLPLVRRRPGKLPLFWGSNFVTLSREFCRFLQSDSLATKCLQNLKYVKLPEEFFFQTALMNSRFAPTVIPDPKRKILWDGEPHPRVLTMKELPALLASGAFFARKFDDSVDAAVLDAIDRERLAPRAAAG